MNILLVEDNPADAQLLMEAFSEKSPALNIEWVADGDEALDYVSRHTDSVMQGPDLVLLDLSLPRVSGYDVLRGIKNNESAKQIPVIVLTTSANPQDVEECKKLGAAAYLCKPSNLEEFENLAHCLVVAELPKYLHSKF